MSKYISKSDIKSIGSRIVSEYLNIINADIYNLESIDPSRVLTEYLGLDVEYRHLSRTGSILGLTSFEEIGVEVLDNDTEDMFFLDGKTVLIEKELTTDYKQRGRCNFTIMHEGCHQILKMLYPDYYGTDVKERRILYYRESDKFQCREEWQANALASEILMPEELVIRNMERVGLSRNLDIINSVWRKREYGKFVCVADKLGVSKKALAIRMKQLGIVNEEYLANPYAITNIYM